MFHRTKRKGIAASTVAAFIGISLLLGSIPVSAKVPTDGKWPNRTNTMYVASGSSSTPWATGAAKWKDNTNFKLSTTIGTSSVYYAYDVYNSNVTWDGLCTVTKSGSTITKAILHTNTYFTSQSKYTNSILAGLTGHEIGHSLGLLEASLVETTSIMYPYTFFSNGTQARVLSPSSSDISVVNDLYPLVAASAEPAEPKLVPAEDGIYLQPSWAVYYENEEALAEAADLVIKGKVSSEKVSVFEKGKYANYTTKTGVVITEVLKGDQKPGQTITVSQMGGTDGNIIVTADHTTHLKKDQEVILFLKKTENEVFIPINEDDGVFINETGVFTNVSSKIELNTNNIK